MMERDAVLDQLGEINVPALLIHGEDDKRYPL
jgi:pimeloyl-ACP methyl ester carboxylesterase